MKKPRLTTEKRRPARWLTPQLQQRIEREAEHLGLSQAECVQLFVTLSSVFRKTVMKKTTVDMKQVFGLVNSPMFGAIVEYLSTAKTTVDTKKEPSDGDAPPAGNDNHSLEKSMPKAPQDEPRRSQNELVPGQISPPARPAPYFAPRPSAPPMPPAPRMPEDDFYFFE